MDDNKVLPPYLQQGELNEEMENNMNIGVIAACIAILGVVAFSIKSFIDVPSILSVLINAWFAGGTVYLVAISYGIVNDLIACRKNLPYFILGHQNYQRGLVKSNDPNVVAIAWGIYATKDLAMIFSTIFTIVSLVTGLIGLPFAAFVLPLIVSTIPFVILGAHLHARKWEKLTQLTFPFISEYQNNRLEYWLKEQKDINTWYANSARNEYGYRIMPLIGLTGLVSFITLSGIAKFLPSILFGIVFTVFLPLGLGILLAISIIIACLFLYIYRDKQVNSNSYKLNYTQSSHSFFKSFGKLGEYVQGILFMVFIIFKAIICCQLC
ncbi:21818_t:CDS:1 [Dentiscutata erythropus]|uniref:21818_t:CDS:1 n=1 Tax=Dentiscutata erythropus TaxID=1348616 RepID=A0A9N9H6N1_9GLOM|nr:21818_t:CDS:1 [Dentiscutata erythropus]